MIQQLQQTEPHLRRWTGVEYDQLRKVGFFDGQDVEFTNGEILLRGQHANGTGRLGGTGALQPRPWTKAEYYRLGELGFFMGQKAELLGGEIMVTSPQKHPHFATIDKAGDTLEQVLGPTVWVRLQGPLDLRLVIEPEPDVSVV